MEAPTTRPVSPSKHVAPLESKVLDPPSEVKSEHPTEIKSEDLTEVKSEDLTEVKTEQTEEEIKSEVKAIPPLPRSSNHPDFLNIAQFMDSFGWMLRLPSLSLDTLEDGLDYTSLEPDLYFDGKIMTVKFG
eukprot:sb/3475101/